MKKFSILFFVIAIILVGCGTKQKQITPTPQVTAPTVEKQSEEQQAPPTNTNDEKGSEDKPTVQDLEKLTDKLDKTTDEKERRIILDDIQKILEKAEENSPKN